jgi:hypothetical protein
LINVRLLTQKQPASKPDADAVADLKIEPATTPTYQGAALVYNVSDIRRTGIGGTNCAVDRVRY